RLPASMRASLAIAAALAQVTDALAESLETALLASRSSTDGGGGSASRRTRRERATHMAQRAPHHGSGKQGFASMDRERQRQIASMGGSSVPADKRPFAQNHQLAAEAGRKGGMA